MTQYKVEMRDVDRRSWNDVASCKESTVTVENCGIEIGHEYVFRVTAYNAGGESETSETSTAIEAMDRFVKPRLDKELLGKERDLTAGQMMRLEAVVEAQPPAKFQWIRPNGEPAGRHAGPLREAGHPAPEGGDPEGEVRAARALGR